MLPDLGGETEVQIMKRIGILAIGGLFFSHAAMAATWSIISFSVEPQNAAAVAEAADDYISGKLF